MQNLEFLSGVGMNHQNDVNAQEWKPFLSIVTIISTLLFLVFLQMEERRLGYSLLKLTREQKTLVEEKRLKTLRLAKMMRPQQIEKMAQTHNNLRKIQSNQIIHLTGMPLSSVERAAR